MLNSWEIVFDKALKYMNEEGNDDKLKKKV